MSQRHFKFLKNAVANLVRGGAGAIVALLLPPFLVHAMSPERYSVWVLVLQLSAYTALLDFGIQTTVGRFVAHANELGDAVQRDRTVSTATALLTGSSVFALILVGLLSWQLPHLFHTMPSALVPEARKALLLVGGSLAIALPTSACMGVFVGLQRFEVPAIIIAGGRLLGAALVIVTIRHGGGLVTMAGVLAVTNIAAAILQGWVCHRFATDVRFSVKLVSRTAAREILSYCLSLSICSFAMLLVTGLDTAIVGYFDFRSVAYYSVAASLVMFIAGIQNALFTILIPEAAVLSARGNAKPLGEMLISATRYGMFILLLIGLPLIIGAKGILTIWVGAAYAQHAAILLQILVIANIIRLAGTPYSTLLIGTGQQRLIMVTPLIEGFSNFFVSIVAGAMLGAVGVALGTVVGAILGILAALCINMPRSTGIIVSRRRFILEGLMRPVLCMIAYGLAVFTVLLSSATQTLPAFFLALLSLVGMGAIIWNWGLTASERQTLRRSFPKISKERLEG